jgi:Leucine-rich repeat (LRR) protein
MKKLYVHNNHIGTLDGSLGKFKFLDELHLSDNRLSDLQGSLQVLAKLKNLRHLNLYGNPIAEEPSYRLKILKALPFLDVLDRHAVTDEDRAQAQRLGQPRIRRDNAKNANPDELSGTMKMMMKEVNAYKKSESKRAEEETAAQFSALASSPFSSTGAPPPAYTFLKSAVSEKSLDEWEKYHLKKAFEQYDKDKSGYLSRQELRSALKDVQDSGKEIVWEQYTSLGVSSNSSNEQKLDALFDALDADDNDKVYRGR